MNEEEWLKRQEEIIVYINELVKSYNRPLGNLTLKIVKEIELKWQNKIVDSHEADHLRHKAIEDIRYIRDFIVGEISK